MADRLGLALLVVSSIALQSSGAVPEDKQFWYKDGADTLQLVLNRPRQESVAKNVVLLVGDGMGMSTITAGRIYRGQEFQLSGEEYQLAFEKFPYVGLAKTYNVNAQVGDSAACATALFCGAKTNFHRVGVDSSSDGDHCTGGQRLTSLIDWAQRDGKATGLVTNTRLTHSTPSAAYAHVHNRHWESNTGNESGCKDIARQLVEDRPGKDIDVLFGGGHQMFLPVTAANPKGRVDGRDLIDDWRNMKGKRGRRQRRHYVSRKDEFDALEPASTDSVLGLFSESHMDFERARDKGPEGQPSLAEMTVKAIQILSQKKHKRGFLLIVEGGRIDHGHHANSAFHALTETAALDEAVKAALDAVDLQQTLVVATADHSHVFTFGGNRTARKTSIMAGRMDHAHHANNAIRALDEVLALEEAVLAAQQLTSRQNTLMVVTADHSHVFTLGGAPRRGNPIFGMDSSVDVDGVPYTTLLYGNGPGHVHNRTLTRTTNTSDDKYRQESAVKLKHETHAGEDVPVYATGPRSHIFTGTFEQSYVAHAIAYAACIGPAQKLCHESPEPKPVKAGGDLYRPSLVLMIVGVALVAFRARLADEALSPV